MSTPIEKQVADLESLLEERLRIRGRDLNARVRKAGRLIPTRIRKEFQAVIRAQDMLSHPKLRPMVNENAVAKSHARAAEWLKTVDPWERRKDRWLAIAGSLAFSFLAICGAVIGLLYWRDLI